MQRMETCGRCGETFGCGGAEGKTSCWCAELPAIMPMGADDCLCPKCLRAEVGRRVGDCFGCLSARTLATKTGAAIFQCLKAESDPRFEKFPRLPMKGCPGRAAA